MFSKIGYSSDLKPVAVYRQALCAKALGDKQSELKRYQQLFHNYPKNKLSVEAKYLAGQLVIDDNPDLALKYFKYVAKKTTDEDYKIASEYYIARIQASKIRYSGKKKMFSRSKTEKVEASFRNYLEKYPDGRLAVNVANNWKKFNQNMTSKDATLVARAYYYAEAYEPAGEMFKKTKIDDSWAVQVANAYQTRDYSSTKTLTEDGVVKYADTITEQDYRLAVDSYLKMFESEQYKASSELFAIAKGKHKDYIWNLKCQNAPQDAKYACYKDLYTNFPNGEYAENAMLNVFNTAILKHDFSTVRNLSKSFIAKYPKSEYVPRVLFWAAKAEQKYNNPASATVYYQNIINNYPDTYYAYRSFWILKGVKGATIKATLDFKPVTYPYKYPDKSDLKYNLLKVQDYDMLAKYSKDKFIKSWVEYEKGNYASSVILARDAMAELPAKPVKSDLRWRLVYPQNFYKQVKQYADQYNNNDALMMGLIREESSFNPLVQSGVGAIGLMQLMPATAHEIGDQHGMDFNTSYLFNPELNIKLGNLYYSTIKNMLEGKEICAVAAYNGGIGSVTRWKSTLKYSDIDEFVEQIPYDETRNYVIKVYRSYWNYTRIYQHQ